VAVERGIEVAICRFGYPSATKWCQKKYCKCGWFKVHSCLEMHSGYDPAQKVRPTGPCYVCATKL